MYSTGTVWALAITSRGKSASSTGFFSIVLSARGKSNFQCATAMPQHQCTAPATSKGLWSTTPYDQACDQDTVYRISI